jgi:hypothetical protein
VLKFEEEAYIVPGMNVPVLLREDFQDNYDISVLCKNGSVQVVVDGAQHTIPVSNALELDKGFKVLWVENDYLRREGVR